jgi:hypothetical protein
MRIAPLPLVACVALTGSALAQGQARTADTVVAAAREALGGSKKIATLKSFVATGRTRQVQGDNLVPIEFELACEWPDKCYRRDEIPARESGPTTVGFSGDELIQLPVPLAPVIPATAGRPGGPAPNPEAQRTARANTAKQDFARLLLGMIVGTVDSYPVTFKYAGEAEAPQGKADMLDVSGPNNFMARLFVFSESHLPIMVTWQAPAGRGGRPAGPGAAAGPSVPAGTAPSGGPPPQVENRIYFADYHDADGFKFPYRLRRAVGADTTEETTFDRFRVNVKIDPKKFEVRK